MARFRFSYVLTLSLSTLALGAVGCSNGQSPTEPSIASLDAPVAATSSSSVSSVSDESRGHGRGGNDDNDNNRRNRRQRGRGADDPAGDDRRDDRRQPNAGAEFEGAVVSVTGNTLLLSGGVRVTVNGATQWIARGDLFTLSQVSASVAAGKPTRVEGRGTRQADGTFVAQTIKAEVDD
jgi:hypothetical protein